MNWKEHTDEETGAKCWRLYFTRTVRGHIHADFSWCVSRVRELPIRWHQAESLELAMRAAEDYAESVPDIGPVLE